LKSGSLFVTTNQRNNRYFQQKDTLVKEIRILKVNFLVVQIFISDGTVSEFFKNEKSERHFLLMDEHKHLLNDTWYYPVFLLSLIHI